MKSFINTAKDIIKENCKALSFASIIILIPIMLLIITKLNPKNADIRDLNNICKATYNTNLALAKGIKDESVNPEEAKNILPLVSSELGDIKKKLVMIETSNSGAKVKEKVSQALDRNILLSNQALSLYMSPDSPTLSKKIGEFKSTLELFIEDLETLNVLGMNKLLPDNSLIFFRNTYTYFDTLLHLDILKDISNSSESDFLLKLSDITSKFDSIKEDYKPAIENIKQQNRSLATLVNDIKEKKNIFSEIEENYYMLTIPESAKAISESLESCINSYDIYINSLSEAVTNDLTSTDKTKISEEYNSAFKKRDDFLQFYNTLLSDIDKLKNN